jgi:hypothetical protein
VTRTGQLEFSVNLASSAALREAGFAWVLVIQDGDIRVSTEHRYAQRPGYHVLRPQVTTLISDWVPRRGEASPEFARDEDEALARGESD